MVQRGTARSWDGYVRHFHTERAGITESEAAAVARVLLA